MSPSTVAIAELVAMFLEGLKERSVFAMALQDRKATGARRGGSRAVRSSLHGLLIFMSRCPCGMGQGSGL